MGRGDKVAAICATLSQPDAERLTGITLLRAGSLHGRAVAGREAATAFFIG
jgi:hypothetical protein